MESKPTEKELALQRAGIINDSETWYYVTLMLMHKLNLQEVVFTLQDIATVSQTKAVLYLPGEPEAKLLYIEREICLEILNARISGRPN